MEEKARPATTVIYNFADWKCVISCYPQQRWAMTDKGNTVKLERKNITMELPKDDFEKYWKVIE